jgi:hypothetical protein
MKSVAVARTATLLLVGFFQCCPSAAWRERWQLDLDVTEVAIPVAPARGTIVPPPGAKLPDRWRSSAG